MIRKTIFLSICLILLGISHLRSQEKIIAVWGFQYPNNPQISRDVSSAINSVLSNLCNPKEFKVRHTEVFSDNLGKGNILDIIDLEPEIEDLLRKMTDQSISISELDKTRKTVSKKYAKKFQADLIVFGSINYSELRGESTIEIIVLRTEDFSEKARERIYILEKETKKNRFWDLFKSRLQFKFQEMEICYSSYNRQRELEERMASELTRYLIPYEYDAWIDKCHENIKTFTSYIYEDTKTDILGNQTLARLYYSNKLRFIAQRDSVLENDLKKLTQSRYRSLDSNNTKCKLMRKRKCINELARDTAKNAQKDLKLSFSEEDSFSRTITDIERRILPAIEKAILKTCR